MLGFSDVQLIEVEPGAVIEQDGKKLTVDDDNCVCKGGAIYLTAKTLAAIKARIPERHPATSIGE